MIASIRRNFGKSGKLIIWLVILSMAGGMILSIRSSRRSADSLGTVNGYDISRSDFQRRVRQENQFLAMLRQQLGGDIEALLGNYGKPEERVINQLINEKLMQSAADTMGMRVSSDYILKKLGDQHFVMQALSGVIPQEALYGRNGINMQAVMHYLQRQGISDADFEDIVAGAIKSNVLSQLIGSAGYIPEIQIREAYIKQFVPKKYGILSVSLENYLKKVKSSKPVVAKDELEPFFFKNSNNYLVPEKRSANVWVFNSRDYNMIINDAEISEYYAKNKKKYIAQPEEMKLRKLTVEIPAQADAKTKSALEKKAQDLLKKAQDNPAIFEKDGKIVAVNRQGKNAAEVAAAFALIKDNDISPVVTTQDGYVIFQRVSRKDATFKPMTEVKNDIAHALKDEKFVKQFNLDGQRIISQSAENAALFKKFIEDKKGQLESVKDITNDSSVKSRKIFGLKDKGRAFFTDGQKGYMVELTGITKGYLPELNAIKEKVIADFYKAEAFKAMENALHEALAKVHNGSSLETVAQQMGATFEKTSLIDPSKKDAFKDLEKKKITTDRLSNLVNVHSALEDITDTNGYIIEVLDVAAIDQADFDKKKQQLRTELNNEFMQTLYGAFAEQLKKTGSIDIVKELQRYIK